MKMKMHARQPKEGSGSGYTSGQGGSTGKYRGTGGGGHSEKMGHLSYGKGGGYDPQGHGGTGKSQKPGWGAGKGKESTTPHAERIPHRGTGVSGGGYDTSAHTNAQHGKGGQAIGKKEGFRPMDYDTKLQGEGAGRLEPSPTHVAVYNHGTATKAHHHPPAPTEPHKFAGVGNAGNAHGYGHPAHLRRGVHRLSGHSKAHRIGAKGAM